MIAGCAGPEIEHEVEYDIRFAEVGGNVGLGGFRHETGASGKKWLPETSGAGGGFVDPDNDGWLDLLLVGGGNLPDPQTSNTQALQFYRNNRDGTFTEATAEVGLEELRAYGFGITAADYDNDGDEDLFFTTLHGDHLFRNEDGIYSEITQEAGVAGPSAWSSSALFFDADNDGYLDLYVGGYVDWSPETDLWCTLDRVNKAYCSPTIYTGAPGRYYRNLGNGTFTDATQEAGFAETHGKTFGVAALDFDRDGYTDLFLANDTAPDELYHNQGNGRFVERGVVGGIAFNERGHALSGMGVDAGVVDGSGEEAVFIGNFSKEPVGVYRHLRDGLFLDHSTRSGIGPASRLTLAFGLFLFDADLDADLDLFVTNGHIQTEIEITNEGITYRQPPHLFVNRGDGTFDDVAADAGFDQRIVGRGAAYGDYDRDGDLDVLVTENGGPVHLWRNESASGAWLRVRLEGRRSNHDGLGTRVVAVTGIHRQERFMRTGSSFMSQLEKTVTFGLGEADRVDSLIVYWPSGQLERLGPLTANQEITLTEMRE